MVTGASSGIGAELARQLAARGLRVALVARRRERLEALVAEIAARGGQASATACDVARRDGVEAATGEILDRFGRVDLLVNNAGIAPHGLFLDQDLDEIERVVGTNLLGTLYFLKAMLPHLCARPRSWIVNLSSFAGRVAQPDEAVYSASKYGVRGLSRALAMELEPHGVHVLCAHPVLVRTEMFTPEVLARMPRRRPAFLEPADFVRGLLEALERGETEVTLPRRYGALARLAALIPGPFYRGVARTRLPVAGRPGSDGP